MGKLDSKGTKKTAGGRGKIKHELQSIGGQNASLPQESEQSNIQSKQRMPESGCLRAAKQIMLVNTQAAPGEETTKMIQAKLPRDDLPEEEWTKMNEEIEECKRLAWKIKPLSRRRVLARLEITKMGRNQAGRGRGAPTCRHCNMCQKD